MGNYCSCGETSQIKKQYITPIGLKRPKSQLKHIFNASDYLNQNSPNSPKSPNSLNSPQKNIIFQQAKVQNKIYSLKDFKRIGILGQGGFGVVELVELKKQKSKDIITKYAMKKIPKNKINGLRDIENLRFERQVLSEIKNNFIIQLKYSFQDQYNCYFVMDYAEGGDLFSFLVNKNNQPLKVQQFKNIRDELASRFILACIVLALQGLHRQNIMYRDLKPENVLIFKNGYPKLADFGLAKRTEESQVSKTIAGTRIYCAPEIIERKGYNKSVDFWTLGIFLYQLIIKSLPFDPKKIIFKKFQDQCHKMQINRDWKDANISQQAKDLINSFLKVDPQKRLGTKGFDEIKNHPFFKDFSWQKLQRMELQSPLKNIVEKYPHQPKQIIQKNYRGEFEYQHINGITYVKMTLSQ